MKKLRSLFIISALLAGPAALAQSGLLPPNTVQAGPPTGASAGLARARSIVATDIALPSGQLLVGQAGGLAAAKALSGDATLTAAGAVTVTKTNGATLTTLATTTPGTGVTAALGVNVGTAGSFVVNGGALGTPSSGTLTNATGLPVGTGVSGLGTGVATALAVNVGTAGAPVVNGGALGTPSSGTLTNATGLPVGTGIAGLGTGVATALSVNVGTAGAPVVNGGALGTPSSGVGTNLTGIPNSALVNSSMTIASTSIALGGSYAPARATATPANPTGTSSLSQVMMGLAGSVTPATSGKVFIAISGQMFQSTGTDGCTVQIRYGTGTAPVNGAAATGITLGPAVSGVMSVNSQSFPFSVHGYVTGLTVSTAYWIDLGTAALTAGTCSLFGIDIVALEQ